MKINIFWFRRDLRLHDNAALYHALKSGVPTVPIFIFDKNILDKLSEKKDGRVNFIYQALKEIQQKLKTLGSSLDIYYGTPEEVFKILIKKYDIDQVYLNHDYEHYAIQRDKMIMSLLNTVEIGFLTFKDQVIFEKDEVVKDNGQPYTVFTPYSNKWKEKMSDFYLSSYPGNKYFKGFHKASPCKFPSLEAMGFIQDEINFPGKDLLTSIQHDYAVMRNFPDANATSRLGIHLRFGTLSIREVARVATKVSSVFLNELIWRDFYQAILWHFPYVGLDKAFKPQYDLISWRNNEVEFERWCNGTTGYPIVDAGMRELNATGFMHNRVRMIVASFLTKHLLIDWRWGESYFATRLLDYEFASNNGGWQWAAGSGCDAAPYFRIFNPYLQTKKFDKDLKYIRKWVPEFEEFNYPPPIVEHEFARKRCLEVYQKALKQT